MFDIEAFASEIIEFTIEDLTEQDIEVTTENQIELVKSYIDALELDDFKPKIFGKFHDALEIALEKLEHKLCLTASTI
jgi:hypothetical protein